MLCYGSGRQPHSRHGESLQRGGERSYEGQRRPGKRGGERRRKVLVFPAVASGNLTLLLTPVICKKMYQRDLGWGRGAREGEFKLGILCSRVCGNSGRFLDLVIGVINSELFPGQ